MCSPHWRAPRSIRAAAVLLLSCYAPTILAADAAQVLGWVEWAQLEPEHVEVKAKLDTGAKTSSIHAVDIEPFERDGADWVRFKMPLKSHSHKASDDSELVFERPVVRTVLIKQHQRKSTRRYVIEIDLCLAGERFTTPATLADRGRFLYPLLLGRTALEGRAVVDPAHKHRAACSCPDAAMTAADSESTH